jgi:hypothetical protein
MREWRPAMTGFGIGVTVALGVAIGERIIAPDVGIAESLMAAMFYGGVGGTIFHFTRLALRNRKPPFDRG